MKDRLPGDWVQALGDRLASFDLESIAAFVDAERSAAAARTAAGESDDVYPPEGQVFRALELTPFASVRAVILGQDPYHEPGQAEGLAFSVAPSVPRNKWPPSLRNIVAELCADTGATPPASGSLEPWARHGVLLLNTVLTVRRGAAFSHAGHGWEQLTSAIVDAVACREEPAAFLLWGGPAKVKGALIDRKRHVVVESAHPSPLSAYRGFLGAHPFTRANAGLCDRHTREVDWRLS